MNLTLSVDEKVVEKARQVAARQGTSLQALVRRYIEALAGAREGVTIVERLEGLWHEADKHFRVTAPRSFKFNRNELYGDRVARRRRNK